MEILSLTQARTTAIDRAVAELKAGRLVVVPTDTVYGLAADAFNVFATTMIFEAKSRPRSLPLPVLVSHAGQAWALTSRVPPGAQALAQAFWPGPLTLVVPEQEGMIWDLGDRGGRVAVRVPDQRDLLAILARTGPLAVTSANITGAPTPRTVEGVRAALGAKVSLYLDAGPSPREDPSTIVDLSGESPVVVREGVIPREEIERVLAA